MTRPHVVSLSDRQLKLLRQAAASLPVQLRDKFLRSVADQLVGEPTDSAVEHSINRALDLATAFNG